MIQISKKMEGTGESIFAKMSRMSGTFNAINLSQGFPDFDISPSLIELVYKNMKAGKNQYAPMPGVPILKEAISEKVQKLYSAEYDSESEITITAGATQGIYSAISAFVREGDEVLFFEPAYDIYLPAIRMNGGVPVAVSLKYPDFQVSWDEVQQRISHRTRMIIINTPHNPTGAILNNQDIEKLIQITKNSDIIILSDEVYEHIIFEGYEHQSICRYPQLKERSIVVFSFGKTFHATGWKIGYCLADKALTNELRKVHQYVVFTCNTPVQYGYAEFLKTIDDYNFIGKTFEKKRDYFIKSIKKSKFSVIPSKGTYFQLLDYQKISDMNDVEFAELLVRKYGVAAIPVSVFSHYNKNNHKLLRFCFAKKDETIEKATKILCRI